MCSRLKQLACILSLALAASAFTGCATLDGSKRAKSEKIAKKKSKRDKGPENYGLYRQRDLDRKLLKRGRAANHGPALDSY